MSQKNHNKPEIEPKTDESFMPLKRIILKDPRWTEGKFDDMHAFLDVALQAQASSEYDFVTYDGTTIHLKHGQYYARRQTLATRWGWSSRAMVEGWEKRMQKRGLLRSWPYSVNNRTVGMIYEIVPYDRLFSVTELATEGATKHATKDVGSADVNEVEDAIDADTIDSTKHEQNNKKETKRKNKNASAAPEALERAVRAAVVSILNGANWGGLQSKYRDMIPEHIYKRWSLKSWAEIKSGHDAILSEILAYERDLEGG